MTSRFSHVRETEFPWTASRIYLNSAGTGPLPERTRLVADEWNRRRQTPDDISDQELFDTMDRARTLAAQLINARASEIACATNTSYGINVAAHGIAFQPGDVVLFSEKEFPANAYPWLALREQGVTVDVVPLTAEGWPDEDAIIARVERGGIRLLAVSLVQSSTGYAVDLARLSAVTRAAGTALVVDAIQGVGTMEIDVEATPVDVLACGAQKWLLSPWGSGFVYVRSGFLRELRPPMTGWMAFEGTDDFTRLTEYSHTLHPDSRRLELVTLPYQDLAAMNVSLALILELGVKHIQAHIAACHAPVLDWATERGVRVTSPTGARASALLCLAPRDARGALAALRDAGVYCTLREGSVRLSPHIFNTPDELRRAAAIVDPYC